MVQALNQKTLFLENYFQPKKILQKMKKRGKKEKLYVGRRTNKYDGWPS